MNTLNRLALPPDAPATPLEIHVHGIGQKSSLSMQNPPESRKGANFLQVLLNKPLFRTYSMANPTGLACHHALKSRPFRTGEDMPLARKTSYREQKSDYLATFRGAYVEIQPNLRTPLIVRLVERNFNHIQYCLYFISVFAQILLGESAKELIDQSEAHILAKISKAETECATALVRLQHLCHETGLEAKGALYNPAGLTLKIATPLAKRLLQLLEMADTLIAMQHYLWIVGIDLLSRSDRFVEEQKIKRLLGGITRTIRTLYTELKTRANAQPEQSITGVTSSRDGLSITSKTGSNETGKQEISPLVKKSTRKTAKVSVPDEGPDGETQPIQSLQA
ncbi:MAG: hypothetical protein KGI54_09250 [Pseudomonadota bacterium]|nr:hypothetical protein [Pseudomonadota bacterium]